MQDAQRSSNALLGYPPDARQLILNADDFGMCRAVNAAISQARRDGLLTSSTLDELLERADPAELEREFRAQIETVLDAGPAPTHLDSHCGVHSRREWAFELTVPEARQIIEEEQIVLPDHRVFQKAWRAVRAGARPGA
jgi:predicted glycoside hydrolase/deacetylase ChbG (UPF0249 family)